MKLKKSAKTGLIVISLSTAAMIAVNMLVSVPDYEHESASAYLEKEVAFTSNQGEVTDSFKVYGGNDDELYIWYAFDEFLAEENETGSGASLAVKLLIENGKVVGHELPDEGELYEDSMKELFPWHVRWRMPRGDVPSSIEREIDIQQTSILAALKEKEEGAE
ncbi:hypothetical protein [Jeotgalibacillus haloalkalitolerans]|uniref:Uncharacterized protein n=1 Tax=Jeotgalibacillus haloalkalitolerans TaxID=3104292 RepID=A0ABU5KPQ3_9BACL|nr:hypothetical protein [Jeotgalibacillus sp. HH7-29]MDZ5713226.1 hypothetical protein [Jeotgalibacillus sp. HH7-29]